MNICVYIYMGVYLRRYVCTYGFMYERIYVCMHLNIYFLWRVFGCMYVWIQTNRHIYIKNTFINIYTHTCNLCTDTNTNTNLHKTNIFTYIHTYTRVYIYIPTYVVRKLKNSKVHTYIRLPTHAYVQFTYVPRGLYLHTHIINYIYTYIHIYIYTLIH